jgi:hypothetical protein
MKNEMGMLELRVRSWGVRVVCIARRRQSVLMMQSWRRSRSFEI